MKRVIPLLLCLAMIAGFCACGKAPTPPRTPAATERPPAAPHESAAPETPAVPEDGAEIDLTILSATMVYGELFAMADAPEEYEGRRVKMKGLFSETEFNGSTHTACLVPDATGCCYQGLDFVLRDPPERYPEKGAEITVAGSFTSYREEVGGNYYIFLKLDDAELLS